MCFSKFHLQNQWLKGLGYMISNINMHNSHDTDGHVRCAFWCLRLSICTERALFQDQAPQLHWLDIWIWEHGFGIWSVLFKLYWCACSSGMIHEFGQIGCPCRSMWQALSINHTINYNFSTLHDLRGYWFAMIIPEILQTWRVDSNHPPAAQVSLPTGCLWPMAWNMRVRP